MKIYKQKVEFESKNQVEFIDITGAVQDVIDKSGIREGQVFVCAPHTTMSVVVNHNEPMLIRDFMRVLYKLIPVGEHYSHDLFELKRGIAVDGRSNGHSHCKAMLVGASETVILEKGKLTLSPRQSIFAVEFDGARKRDVSVQVIGL